jgi:hypothetical protein
MKNICIVTNYNRKYREVAEITIPNLLKYSQKHAIDFYRSEQQLVDDQYIAWNKFIIIQNLLPLYDWIFYIDVDCLIVNSNIKVEDFIDDEYSIIIGENYKPDDWYKDSKTNLEMGTILFKKSPITFQILNEISKPPYDLTHPWQDQFQFMKLLWKNKQWDDSVKKIDAKLMNTIGKYFTTPEDTFIYHCAGGYNPNHKLEMLKNILPICF